MDVLCEDFTRDGWYPMASAPLDGTVVRITWRDATGMWRDGDGNAYADHNRHFCSPPHGNSWKKPAGWLPASPRINAGPLDEALGVIKKHALHYGRCCAIESAWATSNRQPNEEARKEWSSEAALNSMLAAVKNIVENNNVQHAPTAPVALPDLPVIHGGGYSEAQLKHMLTQFATQAIEHDRQMR